MGHTYLKCCNTEFFIYVIAVVFLVLCAGLMSGLTLGLMSMSVIDLEVLAKSGTPKDRLHASKILPIVKQQHLLLCTLLISNAAAMEALPVFLDELVPDWGAILLSVTLILLFGEIIPQSLCTRYGLAIGATVAPLVRVLIWFWFPIAYPISKMLDYLLGKGHKALFRRAELRTLVDMHGNKAGKGGELSLHETNIIAGALELAEKTARDAMTPISETFAIDVNANLDRVLINLILEKGHSRVPVYYEHRTNIIGLVLVKNLVTINPSDKVPVKNVTIRRIPRVSETMPLYDILNEFQKGLSHMAAVVKKPDGKIEKESANLSTGGEEELTVIYIFLTISCNLAYLFLCLRLTFSELISKCEKCHFSKRSEIEHSGRNLLSEEKLKGQTITEEVKEIHSKYFTKGIIEKQKVVRGSSS
ncbi:DUF21 domain-containing protein [Datura stramonium]|uniref:DUF21 domain-containing protein n=1 Tax=Datura stramonium TaxID=4076 RepID=A0ABS8TJH4_DATST|nr:DUF21 domain-containing protein [Datura stramonium]